MEAAETMVVTGIPGNSSGGPGTDNSAFDTPEGPLAPAPSTGVM